MDFCTFRPKLKLIGIRFIRIIFIFFSNQKLPTMKINAFLPMTVFSLIFIFCLVNCVSTGTKLNLKIPNGLYYQRTPAKEKFIEFKTDSVLNSLNIFITDNKRRFTIDINNKSSYSEMDLRIGKTSYLLAVPKLFMTLYDEDSSYYSFGQNGTEDNLASAVVKIVYGNFKASPYPNVKYDPVKIKFENNRIWKHNQDVDKSAYTSSKEFLKIEVSSERKAIISIEHEERRGKVIVCILNATNGKLEEVLNPKSFTKLSFSTDHNVFVIPIIVPNQAGNFGLETDSIKFEVGDPKVNGTVSAEEK